MGDVFTLQGSYSVTPLSPPASGDFDVIAAIDERVVLQRKHADSIDLAADPAQAVNFGGVQNAHVVVLKSLGGKVNAILTTSAGVAQVIPFETFLVLINLTAPATALSLQRVVGTLTTVKVFLGERA